MSRARDTVIASLSAIGARSDASFYANLFSELAPERFALLVVDPRATQGSLLETFVSNIRVLADLGLTPIIVIGVLDEDHTHVRFQSQKLSKELTDAGVQCLKLNTATYGLVGEVRKTCAEGRVPILEVTDTRNRLDLGDLVGELHPDKVIFLQPSGGLSRRERRIAVLNIDSDRTEDYTQSIEQAQFVDYVKQLLREVDTHTHYVIASPLNLLSELFTVKGAGTLIRRGASIKDLKTVRSLDTDVLTTAMESAFGKRLSQTFLKGGFERVYMEENYRAGALLRDVDGLVYLSKFFVTREARGEGLARDIWNMVSADYPKLFWRSREGNPFNEWYTRRCDGMQKLDGWRVFWTGLDPLEAKQAIESAEALPDDFVPSTPPVAEPSPAEAPKEDAAA